MPIRRITLTNGLRVFLAPEPQGFAATVLVLVRAGSEYETKRVNGVSHFLEHMMFKGTARRPRPGMIAHELAALGAQSNAFTDQEYTGYYAKARAEKFPAILDIIADLYTDPLFEPSEIEKERGVILQEIGMYEDDLPSKAQEVLMDLIYGDQPAGWDVAGTKKSVRGLRREDFVRYREERYIPQNTVIVAAGKFSVATTVRFIEERFGGLPRGRIIAKPRTIERQSTLRAKVHFRKADQAHLAMGFRAFDMFDRRRYALRLAADVLGGGDSSRLFMRVREEMGAAYYVGAGTNLSLDHGLLGISAGVDRRTIDDVIRAILRECARLRDEDVSAKELRKSKDHILGNLMLGLETSDELASFYGVQEVFGREVLSPARYAAKIKKVTAREVRDVARAVIRGKNLNIAVVGPYRDPRRFLAAAKLPSSF
jgi:predicted Zn-dependent peptidase